MSQRTEPSHSDAPVRVAEYVRMSTDHQRYSIENQQDLIRAYADTQQMRVVRTYDDPGRSGLTIKDRPGLSRLLADVVGGHIDFVAVLVYDVSRWGRFQDADESAHYEFLCKRAGIQIIYCAEQFASDQTPFGGVLKALKRAMAGEFSREMGVKIAAGKARIGGRGFRIGGRAGYGLRRQVLEDGITPGIVLRDGQRKSIQTDRVTLVPGPVQELRVVQRIYQDYIHHRKSMRQIAADLDAEGVDCQGRSWSRGVIQAILCNEKYIGNNIVGKHSQRLRTPMIINPPDKWLRSDGAFAAIVPREVFDAAIAVRRWNTKNCGPSSELIDALKAVWKREGKLSTAIINRAPDLPATGTLVSRFGTLRNVYTRVGYVLDARYDFHVADRELQALKTQTQQDLIGALDALGITCTRTETGLIIVSQRCTVEVLACRMQGERSGRRGWRIAFERNLMSSTLLAVRLAPGNICVRDILVVPRPALAALPKFIRPRHDDLLSEYRHLTLEAAVQACSKA